MSNSLPQVSDPQTDTPRLPGCFSKWLRVCLHWQSMSSIIPGPTSCRSQLFSINCPFCLGKACKLLQFLVLSLSSPTQSLWGKKSMAAGASEQSRRVSESAQQMIARPLGSTKNARKKLSLRAWLKGTPGMSMYRLTIPICLGSPRSTGWLWGPNAGHLHVPAGLLRCYEQKLGPQGSALGDAGGWGGKN